jgi:hypothetical protein
LILGQDESFFPQFSYSSKGWHGPNGEQKLLPKGREEGIMDSAFQGRETGFGFELTSTDIDKVNEYRSDDSNRE